MAVDSRNADFANHDSVNNFPQDYSNYLDYTATRCNENSFNNYDSNLALRNIEDYARRIEETIIGTFNSVAPVRTFTVTTKRKPWVTPDIRLLMRSRDKAYKVARISGCPIALSNYRRLRNAAGNRLDTAKNTYIANKLDNAPDARAKWRELKKIGISDKKYPSPLLYFTADQLNRHYADISNTAPPLSNTILRNILRTPINANVPVAFDFAPVSASDVLSAIKETSSKSVGVDEITINMLKLTLPNTITYLTKLFNGSLSSGLFPSRWKKAILKPLSKIKSPQSPSDTRPIALLPEISKLLEKIVHRQMSHYLETNKLLNEKQAGFRAGHSTQTALLGVLEDVREAIDNRKITLLILFDFSKAFDTIPHEKLLLKLKNINCSDRVIRWFFNYLHSRLQAVIDEGGKVSDWLKTLAGVPQGSVLGPLLFLLFINDLPDVLQYTKHMIFADDTQIYLHCLPSDIDSGIAKITSDANAVANWATTNGLKLNASKTKVLLLGSEQYTSSFDLANLHKVILDGSPLPYITEALSLGLWIKADLNWDKHIRATSSKVHGLLYSLKHHKHALSKDLRKKLIESLIFSHFDYACAALTDLDKTQTFKLQRLLNACVRFVHGNIPKREHVTPHRLALGWLTAERRREYFIASLAFSAIKFGNPPYLRCRFLKLNHDRVVRRSARLAPQTLLYECFRTEALRRSFKVVASKIINSLHLPDFDEMSPNAFKILLFNELFARDKQEWNLRILNEGLSS